MKQKRCNGSKVIAALLLLSILQISVQVGLAAQQTVGRLTTHNNQPITVNGLSANTGASILSGATIETGADQSATVSVGPLGSVEIAPNTKLILTFDQGNLKALIINGCVTLKANKKTIGEIATEKGSVGTTNPADGGVLKTCFPETAAAPPPSVPTVGAGGLFGLGTAATVVILSSIGAVALTPLIFQSKPSGSAP